MVEFELRETTIEDVRREADGLYFVLNGALSEMAQRIDRANLALRLCTIGLVVLTIGFFVAANWGSVGSLFAICSLAVILVVVLLTEAATRYELRFLLNDAPSDLSGFSYTWTTDILGRRFVSVECNWLPVREQT